MRQKRHAVAIEAGTTVLAVGGVPGKHEPSAWEYFFPALPAYHAENWDEARRILEEARQEHDDSAVRYHLACVEARAGNIERALELLETCDERHWAHARSDDDLASLRADPRFLVLTAGAGTSR